MVCGSDNCFGKRCLMCSHVLRFQYFAPAPHRTVPQSESVAWWFARLHSSALLSFKIASPHFIPQPASRPRPLSGLCSQTYFWFQTNHVILSTTTTKFTSVHMLQPSSVVFFRLSFIYLYLLFSYICCHHHIHHYYIYYCY